jgi:uncharacterized protein (DUF2336 family)
MNFSALIEELNDAIAFGTAERRDDILHRITDVFVAGSADYSDNQIELFDDVFVRIVATVERSARTALANRLANDPRAPLLISRRLASDDEIDVAGPVLEQSQRIDRETLVATARTKGQKHLLAISRRKSLDEAVTNVLVERGDKPVLMNTIANPAARFSDQGYLTLIRRSENDDELSTCVGLRRDIPRQHLLRLLVRASHAVCIKLEAMDPSMSDLIQDAVTEAATVLLDKTNTKSQDYVIARAHIESMHAAGRLAESDVAAFAQTNQFEKTTAALAALCDIPIEAVDRAMVHDQPDTILVMTKATGMSWPTVKAILRMRASPRGISPAEIEQCLNTFVRLKPATAQQAIEFQRKRLRSTQFNQLTA